MRCVTILFVFCFVSSLRLWLSCGCPARSLFIFSSWFFLVFIFYFFPECLIFCFARSYALCLSVEHANGIMFVDGRTYPRGNVWPSFRWALWAELNWNFENRHIHWLASSFVSTCFKPFLFLSRCSVNYEIVLYENYVIW